MEIWETDVITQNAGYNLECAGKYNIWSQIDYCREDHKDKYDNYLIVMPNKKLTKEENQPSIKTLLPNHTESVECINVDQEGVNTEIDINNINNSSTVRPCTDTDYASPLPTADQTLSDPELTGFKEVKLAKKRKRKSRSSGSPQNQPSKKVNTTEANRMDGQGFHVTPSPHRLLWK